MTTANDKAFLARKVLSSDGPNAMERQHDASLAEWCLTRLEPEEESHRRRSVLERIHSSVRTWIRQTMITEFRMPESDAAMVEGRIFATGSYRYNVHTSGSDIDMVLIAPNRITRDHFFMKLAPRLKAEPWVSDLHCIQDSRVPIIAMVCDGIDIDLSFGCIRQDRVPEVITDDLLQGLDDQSILSCNAVRVAHSIMDLVPNKAAFRQTLRFVKAWGKSRAIYSNTFGFPSGIGWAILVAFACQCYPNQNPAGMVCKFFRLYHMWFKPNPHEAGVENNAIYLTESMRVKTNNLGKAWDPRTSKSDARALFPVLTPAAPYGNACFNVTLTNLKQLCDEFARGYEITSGSVSLSPAEAKATMGAYGIWSKVLEPVSFFGCYRHYMHVQVSCRDAEHYQAYADGVESRIRTLWAGNATSWGHTLEDMKQLRLHLNPRRYEDPEEVAIRSGLLAQCKAANARASAGLSRRGSTMADSSAHSSPRSSALPSAVGGPTTSTSPTIAAGGTTWFTAHYFIGLTVNTSVSSAPIDVAPSIRVFHTAVKQLRQYREGVTKLPVIAVCEMQGIPSFVKEEAGYVEPVATDGGDDAVAAAGPASEAGANNTSSEPQNSMSSVGPAQGNGDAAVSGTSMKRGREEGGEGISTVPATKKTANSSPLMNPMTLRWPLAWISKPLPDLRIFCLILFFFVCV